MAHELLIRPIARIRTDFPEKFGIPRQAGIAAQLQGEIVFEEKDGVLYFGTEKDPEAEVYIPGIIPDRGTEAGSVPEDSGQRAAEPEEKALTDDLQERDYVVNLNTGKFHLPDCASVSEMREKNRLYVHCSRTELTDRGYEPCRNCNP